MPQKGLTAVAVCGSPRLGGSTETLLVRCLERMERSGIKGQLITLRFKRILPCRRCGACQIMRNGVCKIENDDFGSIFRAMSGADILVIGAPVDLGAAVPGLKMLLERSSRVSRGNESFFYRKPGALIAVVRQKVSRHTLARLLAWFQMQGMIMPGSLFDRIQSKPGETAIRDDVEGKLAVDRLADNLAWLAEKLAPPHARGSSRPG